MPLHKASTALVVALAMAMVLGACSRLSFVRPDVSRGDYTQTAPVIEVTDGDRVPVLLLDGKEHGYWRIEEERLLRDLSRPPGEPRL